MIIFVILLLLFVLLGGDHLILFPHVILKPVYIVLLKIVFVSIVIIVITIHTVHIHAISVAIEVHIIIIEHFLFF